MPTSRSETTTLRLRLHVALILYVMGKKRKILQALLFIAVAWYAFCILILNQNHGMISLSSIGELTVTLRELNIKSADQVRDFLDQSKANEGLETKYKAFRWKLYHHGWIEQIGENEWIWKMSEKNQYRVRLEDSNDSWRLVAEPLQEYVYLHPMWYRIATLDFYKIECEGMTYDGSTHEALVTSN